MLSHPVSPNEYDGDGLTTVADVVPLASRGATRTSALAGATINQAFIPASVLSDLSCPAARSISFRTGKPGGPVRHNRFRSSAGPGHEDRRRIRTPTVVFRKEWL
ncbi:hypothetical protein Ntsu_09740 [Nocardia sp. IFM 10818]